MKIAPLQRLNLPETRAELTRYQGRWLWTIETHDEPLEIPAKTDNEIRLIQPLVAEGLTSFANAVRDWAAYSERQQILYLENLRQVGRALTRVLFDGREDEFVEQIQYLRIPVIIQKYPDTEMQIPIDLCVLRDGEEEFFLGQRFPSIFRLSTRDLSELRKRIPATRELIGTGPVGYAEDDALLSACEIPETPTRPEYEEIYAVQKLLGTEEVPNVLGQVSADLNGADLKVIHDWMSVRYRVMHFNSHVRRPSAKLRQPHLQLRSSALVSEHELLPTAGLDLTGTFVFLNACSSLIGSESFSTSLTYFFRKYGAPCVACTTGPVDDAFATQFAHELYGNLRVKKLPIFDALVQARKTLTEEAGHPMALLYTYVGRDDFVLR